MVHFNYLDTSHFLEKLNRYTSIEAQAGFARRERSSIPRTIRSAAREWWQRYVSGRGYRDGWRGFYLSTFMAFYRVVVQAKLRELSDLGGRVEIEAGYRREANRLLEEYGETALPHDVPEIDNRAAGPGQGVEARRRPPH
jgi:hypothetical protein